jgi:Ca-activated chloride channel family protein
MELARPAMLLLLLPVLALAVWRHRQPADPAAVRYSRLRLFPRQTASIRTRLHSLLPWLSLLAVVLVVIGLAQPRQAQLSQEVEGEGIDVIVALDISGSMRALDFQPQDRLGVAKEVIRDFVAARPHDRVGLVLFAAQAFTQCPLTLDHEVLTSFLEEVQVGLIADDNLSTRTAIGLGLATAVNRLKHSQAKSKTVVLLTDGMNNVMTLEPETAAEMAKALGVRVYTVGVGREGYAPYPIDDPHFGRRLQQIETRIDEELLRRIATATGGSYFRAEDPQTLAEIFATIDRLETSRYEMKVSSYHRQLVGWFLVPAVCLLGLEALLGTTWLRRLP